MSKLKVRSKYEIKQPLINSIYNDAFIYFNYVWTWF